MKRFYRNEEVEQIVEERLVELKRKLGRPLAPPIPIDLFAEKVLGLSILWEEIEELPGEIIFGAIKLQERLIILNERRKALFIEKPGLERSTKGHEAGHFDLYVDKSTLDHPVLFDMGDGPFSRRHTPSGQAAVLRILHEPAAREILRQIEARRDEPDEARAVNRYAAAVSMPRAMIRQEAMKIDRTRRPDLYRLAERFGVTITALRVRLEQLDLLYVSKDRKLYASRDQATGQLGLGF